MSPVQALCAQPPHQIISTSPCHQFRFCFAMSPVQVLSAQSDKGSLAEDDGVAVFVSGFLLCESALLAAVSPQCPAKACCLWRVPGVEKKAWCQWRAPGIEKNAGAAGRQGSRHRMYPCCGKRRAQCVCDWTWYRAKVNEANLKKFFQNISESQILRGSDTADTGWFIASLPLIPQPALTEPRLIGFGGGASRFGASAIPTLGRIWSKPCSRLQSLTGKEYGTHCRGGMTMSRKSSGARSIRQRCASGATLATPSGAP
jgi:hypothetical protein